jgi:NADH:ubiquinone oxidoreductase subunit F (NADH-binding)
LTRRGEELWRTSAGWRCDVVSSVNSLRSSKPDGEKRHHTRQAAIDSFYHLPDGNLRDLGCQGTACFVARQLDPARWNASIEQHPPIHCLGKCYAAPAISSGDERPRIEVHAPEAIVLANLEHGSARRISQYLSLGGYSALNSALFREPEQILAEIDHSGLRGRGGAGFPTGMKWRAVAQQDSPEKFVIANADEGDPGAYTDRFLLEEDPHRVLEAMAIAGYATGAKRGYVYLRKEYPHAYTALLEALAEARAEGFLGNETLHKSFSFDVDLVVGQGSYVCGEETALLNSIEGLRPEVRPRPPYPTECGLFQKPTLVHNVETLANVPWIVQHGGEAYRNIGFSRSRGTKVLSLNSLFVRPGLYEVPFGMPIRKILEGLGGGLRTGNVRGVIIGGPLAGVIPPNCFDTLLGFEELAGIGASVGHGGVIAFDENTSLPELIHHVFAFGAFESCGKCTPCRLGSRRMEGIFGTILRTGRTSIQEKADCEAIISCLARTSLCGLGTGLAEFASSILRHYREDIDRCFA